MIMFDLINESDGRTNWVRLEKLNAGMRVGFQNSWLCCASDV